MGGGLFAGRAGIWLDARQASDVWGDAAGGVAVDEGFRARGLRGGCRFELWIPSRGDGEAERPHDLFAGCDRYHIAARTHDAVRPIRVAIHKRSASGGWPCRIT